MNTGCDACRLNASFVPFSMAFQPIVDIRSATVFAHEALVRGVNGEGAHSILSTVNDTNRYTFDQRCRVTAIETAASLRLADEGACLSINFMPNAIYEPRACIRLTLDAARRTSFPLDRIIFEFTETENLDTEHVLEILRTYKKIGFRTAIDDFGAGHSGLSLLSRFQPDFVKLDMDLIRNIDSDLVKRSILRHLLGLLDDLSIRPICEGVETFEEFAVLQDHGVELMQGYLLAKPAFEALAEVTVPERATTSSKAGAGTSVPCPASSDRRGAAHVPANSEPPEASSAPCTA